MPNLASRKSPPPPTALDQEPATQPSQESTPDDEEFEITVKKLDRVVRPRGVLAE